jgi:hypothetical protein
VVVSAISKAEGKLFRAEGLVFASPERLFSFLYDRFDHYPQWTSIWSSCKVRSASAVGVMHFFARSFVSLTPVFRPQTLRRIDRHTDMVYMAMTEKGTVGLLQSALARVCLSENQAMSLANTLPIPTALRFSFSSCRFLAVISPWYGNGAKTTATLLLRIRASSQYIHMSLSIRISCTLLS